LDIREKNDELQDQVRKLKLELKSLTKKLSSGGQQDDNFESSTSRFDETVNAQVQPVIRKKEREYLGMLEYSVDEGKIVRALIVDLKTQTAINCLPGLPAYILFMCIRYTDYLNDDLKVRSLLNAAINTVKKVINKKGTKDLDVSVLWLSNILRLLHTLKQYSGDANFQRDNSPQQNEQALKNFDLSEYRQVLSDIAIWIYTMVIKLLEDKIQPLIVPALLESDSGLTSSVSVVGNRSRQSSVSSEPGTAIQKPLEAMTQQLDIMYNLFSAYGVDPEVVIQIFRQLFYYMCAGALNNLLLRKDLCHWSKGMQIRYNISMLEEWCLKHKVNADVTSTLVQLIQASQLLQARKTENDVDSICDICDKLTINQVIKLLNLYTSDEYEGRLSTTIIRNVQNRLKERRKEELEKQQAEGKASQLLMDTKHLFAVKFPFNPSSIGLETIEIPESFGLSNLVKRL
jgi:myosin-5